MNTKNTFSSLRRLFMATSFLLLATTGAFAQNLFFFHDYSGDHLWSNPENWFEGLKPVDEFAEVGVHTDVIIDEDVDILRIWDFTNCNLTIQSGKKLTVREDVSWEYGGIFIIEDGAQLVHQNYYLEAKVLKKITAYDANTHLWNLISSPIIEDIVPTTENGILTELESDFALYAYNEENHSWINYKEEPFTLANGIGYLYSNALDTTLVFSGNVRACTAPAMIYLSYHASNGNSAGCNFVGNPLPCNAFTNKSYYVFNEESNALTAVALSTCTPVSPCTGIVVNAKEAGDFVTFSHERPLSSENHGYIEITAAKSDAQNLILDQALLSFNPDDNLTKYHFFKDSPQVYFTKDGQDLAILSIDSVSMQPIKFKAAENGSYTLHFEPIDMNISYLHLSDNITGINVDLLSSPNYTFNANTSDYASRFKLVFDPHYGVEEYGNEAFAYVLDGHIYINDVETCHGASLQVVDMTGRVVISVGDVSGNVSTTGMAPGVYVLRLNDGNTIRTQKMVIE